MNIWKLVSNNLFQKVHTRRPDAPVPYPGGFRGDLLHETSLCTACETCVYVCSPAAIQIDRTQPEGAIWQYQSLQCTYCGRCVDNCPTHALSFAVEPQTQVLHDLELVKHFIAYQACPRCGELVIPLPEAALEAQYGLPLPEEIVKLNRLCVRCRKKVQSASVKRGFIGETAGRFK